MYGWIFTAHFFYIHVTNTDIARLDLNRFVTFSNINPTKKEKAVVFSITESDKKRGTDLSHNLTATRNNISIYHLSDKLPSGCELFC